VGRQQHGAAKKFGEGRDTGHGCTGGVYVCGAASGARRFGGSTGEKGKLLSELKTQGFSLRGCFLERRGLDETKDWAKCVWPAHQQKSYKSWFGRQGECGEGKIEESNTTP